MRNFPDRFYAEYTHTHTYTHIAAHTLTHTNTLHALVGVLITGANASHRAPRRALGHNNNSRLFNDASSARVRVRKSCTHPAEWCQVQRCLRVCLYECGRVELSVHLRAQHPRQSSVAHITLLINSHRRRRRTAEFVVTSHTHSHWWVAFRLFVVRYLKCLSVLYTAKMHSHTHLRCALIGN